MIHAGVIRPRVIVAIILCVGAEILVQVYMMYCRIFHGLIRGCSDITKHVSDVRIHLSPFKLLSNRFELVDRSQFGKTRRSMATTYTYLGLSPIACGLSTSQ